MYGQSQVFSLKIFAKESLMIQFWRLYKPLDWVNENCEENFWVHLKIFFLIV